MRRVPLAGKKRGFDRGVHPSGPVSRPLSTLSKTPAVVNQN
jgi:hypothetical protein